MDTEPFDYIDGCNDPLYDNQVDVMPPDTEVLNSQDLFENSEAQQMDQFDNVVVPDSDDEAQNTIMNKRSFCRRGHFSGRSGSLCKILRRFGIPMAACPADATHFVTNKFARTRNLLEFIAQGKPVVTHMWLESCEQAGSYIDEGNYILRDVKKELEIGFRLPVSLEKARNHPLLKGFWVAITPSTQPSREMLSSLVKTSHGQVIELATEATVKDKTVQENFLLLSCEEDRAYCAPFLQKGIAAYCSELLLNGIIIQKLEFKRHQLFTDHV